MIYLDNAATSRPKPEAVYRAMDHFLRNVGASPGRASYREAVEAGRMLEETRKAVRELFQAPAGTEVIFTHNCTDSLNIALKGLLKPGDHVITSHLEHNSVSRPLNRLKELGISYTRLPHDASGFIDPGDIKRFVRPETRMIVLTHASNVLGAVEPADEIGRAARELGLTFLLDAAQTAGTIPISLKATDIDLFACSGHKGLLGPPGTGLLLIREGLLIEPLREGGTGSASEEPVQPAGYPDRLEAGTPNLVGIAGLKAAVEFLLARGVDSVRKQELALMNLLWDGLSQLPGITLYGPAQAGLRTGLLSFNTGLAPAEVALILDAGYRIACRAGLHCAPWAHQALGTFPSGAVRFSVGIFNTEAEINAAVEAVGELIT